MLYMYFDISASYDHDITVYGMFFVVCTIISIFVLFFDFDIRRRGNSFSMYSSDTTATFSRVVTQGESTAEVWGWTVKGCFPQKSAFFIL